MNSVAFLKFWEKEELPTVNGIAPVDIVNGSEVWIILLCRQLRQFVLTTKLNIV